MAFDKSAAPQKNRKRRKVCQFCVDKAEYIDYKDTVKLRKYLSERSKILPRRLRLPSASAHRGDQACPSGRYPALRDRLILVFYRQKSSHPSGMGAFSVAQRQIGGYNESRKKHNMQQYIYGG